MNLGEILTSHEILAASTLPRSDIFCPNLGLVQNLFCTCQDQILQKYCNIVDTKPLYNYDSLTVHLCVIMILWV